MWRRLALILACGVLAGCASPPDAPVSLRLQQCPKQKDAWTAALSSATGDRREDLRFLLLNMPVQDLNSLSPDYVLADIDLAERARSATPWAAAIPREIFLRDVLPFANVDESRDDWRADFYRRFLPLVKDCRSASEAAMALNAKIFPMLNVKYDPVKRRIPNQGPAETMQIGYASCTGLSILLCDACRAVGVPARLAGTPMWYDDSGNHTWSEIWDGQWHFLASAEPGPLDHGWFVQRASHATTQPAGHGIYAVSFERTPLPFPMVWNPDATGPSAVDVTAFYVKRANLTIASQGSAAIDVRDVDGGLIAESRGSPASFDLPADCDYQIQAIAEDGTVLLTWRAHLRERDGGVGSMELKR